MSLEWLKERWHRVLAVVAALVGIVLVVAGWVGVSDSSLTTEQIPYLASGAVGGLFALGVAATAWLSADLRDEFVKLDQIYQWLQGETNPAASEQSLTAPAEADTSQHGNGAAEIDVAFEPAYASAAPRHRSLGARPSATSAEP